MIRKWIAILSLPLLVAACVDYDEFDADAIMEPEATDVLSTSEDDNVSAEDIDNIVNQLFPAKTRSTEAGDYSTAVIYNSKGVPSIYVVNFAGDRGFLLVSASKKHEPVLAYSDRGNYALTDFEKPLALLEWQNSKIEDVQRAREESDTLDHRWNTFKKCIPYDRESVVVSRSDPYGLETMISDSIKSWNQKGYSVSTIDTYVPRDENERYMIEDMCNNMYPMAVENWKDYVFVVTYHEVKETRIGDLLGTQWRQDAGFNANFPIYSGTARRVVGCGPIAAGQIMRYHKKPTNIEWSKMPATYATATTAAFLYELALRANADFKKDKNETSTNISGMKKAFESYGYKCKLDDYSHYTVRRNIEAKRPVYMRGAGGSSAHAWVVSGVWTIEVSDNVIVYHPLSKSMMHPMIRHQDNYSYTYSHYCNWGWGGSCDGFYGMDRFNPGNDNFSSNKRILYDIY
ncbi:MAG: C10 family peptidase [Muribaculaceae bacterium]|nr:C10 family peptidase [Muribaculaceae bacterium]